MSDKHPALSGGHHALITAEDPKFSSHPGGNEALENELKAHNYKYEKVKGQYDKPENSFLIHDPDPEHIKQLGHKYGQESVLLSHNGKHQLHFTNGEKHGQWHEGEGTVEHQEKPSNYYSTLQGGQHFTHNIDFSKLHGAPKMAKNEDSGETLVHYSNKSGLKEIGPNHMGTGAPSSEYKRGLPEIARAYFYHGGEPESIVTQGAKSKYHVKLAPHHKIYDLAHDADGHVKNTVAENQGAWNSDKILGKIKEAGYSGFKNSSSSLPHVVALFHSHPVEHEEVLKSDMAKIEKRCWSGYKPTPGKKPYSKGSCMKKGLEKYFIELPLTKSFQENGLTYAAEHESTGAIFILRKHEDHVHIDGHFGGKVYELGAEKSEAAAQAKLDEVMATYAEAHMEKAEPKKDKKVPNGGEMSDASEVLDISDEKKEKAQRKAIDHKDMVPVYKNIDMDLIKSAIKEAAKKKMKKAQPKMPKPKLPKQTKINQSKIAAVGNIKK